MNRRDIELLDRQLHDTSAPRGLLGPLALAVFVIGFLLGAMVFSHRPDPGATAHDVLAATPFTSNGPILQ
jgi:hypothetical protein